MKALFRSHVAVCFGMALGSAALVVIYPMVAWACSQHASLTISDNGPNYVPPGQLVKLNGVAFPAGQVTLRWNASTGPALKTVNGPAFDTTFAIPSSPPGVYYLVAVAPGRDDPDHVARLPFEVTGDSSEVKGVPSSSPPSAPPPTLSHPNAPPATTTSVMASAAGPAAATAADSSPRGRASAPGSHPPVPTAEKRRTSSGEGAQTVTAGALSTGSSASSDLWSGFARSEGAHAIGLGAPARTSTSGHQAVIGWGLVGAGILLLLGMASIGLKRPQRATITA